MVFIYGLLSVFVITLFIYMMLKEKSLMAFFLKGLASFSFIGFFGLIFLMRFDELPLSQIFQVLLIFDVLLGIVLILLGLISGLIGDLFLALRPLRPKTEDHLIINAGLIAFMIGHIFYVSALIEFGAFSWWAIGFGVVVAIMVYIFGQKMKLKLGMMTWLIVFYSFLISLFLGLTISFLFISTVSMQSYLLIIGATLFLISNVMIAPVYFFEVDHKLWRIFGLASYYLAQFMIAASIYYVI
ncbi:MAG: lysoplasmalogenase family protein [Acholeplasmataceae bacterium]